jgi:hypothetical protein
MNTNGKRLTFTPLARGRYRCNQTQEVLTQKQILGYVMGLLAREKLAALSMSKSRTSKTKKQ